MASAYYIADSGGANVINFDVDPEPIPTLQRNRRIVEKALLPSKTGSDYIAGGSKMTDLGASRIGGRFTIFIPYLIDSNLDSILNKFSNPSSEIINSVRFYHADDTVIYTCVFAESNSLNYRRPVGIGTGFYEVEINLIVTGVV